MRMDRPRRFSPLWLIGIIIVVIGTVMVFAASEGPTAVASKFLTALGKGDTATLAKLSYLDGQSDEETKKQWDKTMKASRHYLFAWRITGDETQGDNTAVVRLMWVKDAAAKNAYEDVAQLPMIKVDGKWKVDVASISRELYPALPR